MNKMFKNMQKISLYTFPNFQNLPKTNSSITHNEHTVWARNKPKLLTYKTEMKLPILIFGTNNYGSLCHMWFSHEFAAWTYVIWMSQKEKKIQSRNLKCSFNEMKIQFPLNETISKTSKPLHRQGSKIYKHSFKKNP